MTTKLIVLQCRVITEYECAYLKRYKEKPSFVSFVDYPFIIFIKNPYSFLRIGMRLPQIIYQKCKF